jgi:hypothetical protein
LVTHFVEFHDDNAFVTQKKDSVRCLFLSAAPKTKTVRTINCTNIFFCSLSEPPKLLVHDDISPKMSCGCSWCLVFCNPPRLRFWTWIVHLKFIFGLLFKLPGVLNIRIFLNQYEFKNFFVLVVYLSLYCDAHK